MKKLLILLLLVSSVCGAQTQFGPFDPGAVRKTDYAVDQALKMDTDGSNAAAAVTLKDLELTGNLIGVEASFTGTVAVAEQVKAEADNIYFTGPGPQTLIAGSYDTTGYFGIVSGDEFIHGWEVLNQLWGVGAADEAGLIAAWGVSGVGSLDFTGISYTDTEQNTTVDWLKFCSKGEIIFVPIKPLVNTISWNDIDAVIDPVNGTDITVDVSRWGTNYTAGTASVSVRLLTGANNNPTWGVIANRGKAGVKLGAGSEWNNLMYRICTQIPTDTNIYSGGAQIGSNWAELTISQLGLNSNDRGRGAWCSESYGEALSYRIRRGGIGNVGDITSVAVSNAETRMGFRPALVLKIH